MKHTICITITIGVLLVPSLVRAGAIYGDYFDPNDRTCQGEMAALAEAAFAYEAFDPNPNVDHALLKAPHKRVIHHITEQGDLSANQHEQKTTDLELVRIAWRKYKTDYEEELTQTPGNMTSQVDRQRWARNQAAPELRNSLNELFSDRSTDFKLKGRPRSDLKQFFLQGEKISPGRINRLGGLLRLEAKNVRFMSLYFDALRKSSEPPEGFPAIEGEMLAQEKAKAANWAILSMAKKETWIEDSGPIKYEGSYFPTGTKADVVLRKAKKLLLSQNLPENHRNVLVRLIEFYTQTIPLARTQDMPEADTSSNANPYEQSPANDKLIMYHSAPRPPRRFIKLVGELQRIFGPEG